MRHRLWLLTGAALLVINTVQWLVVEAVVANAWDDPAYSYASNYISDLGVPECGAEFQGRDICSPLHGLMNATFIAQGVLFALGVILLTGLLSGRTRQVVVVLAVLHAVGFLLVGLFHGSLDGPSGGLVIHIVGAGVGILCANAIVIVAGTKRGLLLPAMYRRFSVAIGILGLLSEALVNLSTETAGLFERGGVYSWLLWGLVTGVVLIVRELRQMPVEQNVPA